MNNRSFTLIELLVVIAIVGILSGIVLMSSSGAVNSAQDTRIKKDIDSIRKVILSYKALYGVAPIEDPVCNIGSDCSQLSSDLLAMNPSISFPTNPLGGYYTYYSADGTDFTLTATLSNNQTLAYDSETGYSQYTGLAGYSKRKSITISSSASLTDYQAKVDVTYDSDMLSSFDDLRFTLSNGTTELNYWTESVSAGVSAVVWVKVPSLAIGDNTIYMYYGNASASTASNGDNTFEFFDGFEGASIDTTKWPQRGGVPVLSGSRLTGQFNIRDGSYATGSRTINTAIKLFGTINYGSANRAFIGYYDYVSAQEHIAQFDGNTPTANVYNTRTVKTGTATTSNLGNTYTGDHFWEICRNNTTSVIYKIDGSTVATHTTNIPTIGMLIQLGDIAAGTNSIDWVLVRKYISSEPSISSWGTEESL